MADRDPKQRPMRSPVYRRIGRVMALIDRFGVDGLINALGFAVFAAAEGLRTLHNGRVQTGLIAALLLLVAVVIAVMLGLPNLFLGASLTGSRPC